MATNKKDSQEQLLDVVTQLNKVLEKVAAHFDVVNDKAKNLSDILLEAASNEEDIVKALKKQEDMATNLAKGGKDARKETEKILDIQRNKLEKVWKQRLKDVEKIHGITEKSKSADIQAMRKGVEYSKIKQEHLKLRSKELGMLESQLISLKEQEKQEKKRRRESSIWQNGQKLVNKGIEAGYNPQQAMEEVSGKISGGLSMLPVLGPMIGGALELILKSLFAVYEQAERTQRAAGMLNKEFGNMGEASREATRQAAGLGIQYEKLGLGFDAAIQSVIGLKKGLMTAKMSKEELDIGVRLADGLGLGAEATGKLMKMFERTGSSLKGLKEMTKLSMVESEKYGVSFGQVMKDISDSPEALHRFGVRNYAELVKASAKMHSYGLTIKETTSMFGKQLDSFEATSTAAAKMNALFGTNINSLEYMMAMKPEKRFEMLRKAMLNTGKTWEDLNEFEKGALMNMHKMTEEQAALTFGSEKERKAIIARNREKDHQINVDKKWNNMLTDSKTIIINMKEEINTVLRSIGGLVLRMFGKDTKSITTIPDMIKEAVKQISGFIDGLDVSKMAQIFKDITDILSNLGDALGFLKTSDEMKKQKESDKQWDDLQKRLGKTDFGTKESEDLLVEEANLKYARKHTKRRKKDTSMGGIFELSMSDGMLDEGTVNDALITKTGQIVKFNPSDNIIATKGPINQTSQGVTATAGKSSSQGQTEVYVVPINLDSKKIGEAMVRVSRRG